MHKLNHLFVSETGTNHMFQLATFSNKLDSTLKVTKVFCQWILGDTLETSHTVIFLYCECSLCYPFEAQTQRFWVARSFPPVQNSVDKSEMKIGLNLINFLHFRFAPFTILISIALSYEGENWTWCIGGTVAHCWKLEGIQPSTMVFSSGFTKQYIKTLCK